MAPCFAKILLTLYLVSFLISGGRVCSCEALSWIGIDVHHFVSDEAKSSECCHSTTEKSDHLDHDHHHDTPEKSDQTPERGDCCEIAFQLIEAELPRTISTADIDPLNQSFLLYSDRLLALNPVFDPEKTWKRPPPTPAFSTVAKHLIHQRFNV